MSWNENACQFCREALVQLPPSWSPHPPPHTESRQAIANSGMQGASIHWKDRDQGPTTYQGHSAQVRNLHVVNLRLWCNFSEVPGELLMGPGQVEHSCLPTPWLRTSVGLRPSTQGCGVFSGPHPTDRTEAVSRFDRRAPCQSSQCLPGELPRAQAPGLKERIKLRKDRRTLVSTSKQVQIKQKLQ